MGDADQPRRHLASRHAGLRPEGGRYLDQSIGDTPKVYTIDRDGKPTKVVGCGCKNGGFYVLNAANGKLVEQTPVYTGKPTYPLDPAPDSRMLALPGPLGGLQTGCATDGKSIFTNGLDGLKLGTQETEAGSMAPPTAGRVVCISGDTQVEALAARAAQDRAGWGYAQGTAEGSWRPGRFRSRGCKWRCLLHDDDQQEVDRARCRKR